jgi:tRNA (cytidine/uridine-2'-O-)-methyltransferase
MLNVVLHRPEIPPNTGNIGRLCHASGASLHLVAPLGFSLDDRLVRRAGLDYWRELSPRIWDGLDPLLASVREGAKVWLLTTKVERPYWDATFSPGDFLLFGSESRGLPESLLASRHDSCLTIPQVAGRSLNLATAVGIVLYEGIRQLSR